MKKIFGKKAGMTQIFTEDGVSIPVTVIEAYPAKVVQIKTEATDGYDAVKVAYMETKEHRINKPKKGELDKAKAGTMSKMAEFTPENGVEYKVGDVITVSELSEGNKVDVTGTSKGKGTAGNIKRHGHRRGPMSHGSKHKRLAGALAGAAYPGRVFKGNKGPGHMGDEQVTVQNLDLVKLIEDRNVLLVKGAIPGKKGGEVMVTYSKKSEYVLSGKAAEDAIAAREAARAKQEEAEKAANKAPKKTQAAKSDEEKTAQPDEQVKENANEGKAEVEEQEATMAEESKEEASNEESAEATAENKEEAVTDDKDN